jgi:hypothetical protein
VAPTSSSPQGGEAEVVERARIAVALAVGGLQEFDERQLEDARR